MASEKFLLEDEMKWQEVGPGVQRMILGFDNQIMMVKVKFEKGSIGSAHQHFHTQTTYCASGKFEFNVDGKKSMLKEGDGVYIQPNLIHGTVCLETGILIDVFSPVREDFLDGTAVSYFGSNK